jgi:hypothetical protein
MEVQQDVGRIQDVVGAISGTISGALGGALAGSAVAPGVGTAVGAVSGAIASGVGGIADYALNERLRNEAIDYTKDQFNYSLQNIQALPYTLSRVSAINIDNTIYPILEYYTCTDKEKEALINKLKYNGMTVMVIGKINEYALTGITNTGEQYIKGKIIRLEGLNEEYHLANQIVSEINKGVFI